MAGQQPIIFPTDFSTASLAGLHWAVRMAQITNAALHVIYVVEEPQVFGVLEVEVGQATLPSLDDLQKGARTRIEAFVAANLADKEIDVVEQVIVGNPSNEITRYADEVGAAMIVMGAHGYSGVRHLILGSTTESTLRHARCPVLCVKGDGTPVKS